MSWISIIIAGVLTYLTRMTMVALVRREMLGDKQSGHIDNIGLSLYLSMLKDAINSQKDTKESIKKDIEINFYDSAYISEDYLPSPLERLKIYKKL